MAKEIRWTTEAEVTYQKIITYLEENWTDKEVSNFINTANTVIFFIAENPLMYRQSNKKNIHEALITKHNLLLYRVKPNHIELLTFWDTRQNPKKKLKRSK